MKKIALILLISMFSFSGLFADNYASYLKIINLAEFPDGLMIGFDRNPWDRDFVYTYYGFHCIIKKEERGDADYNRLLAFFMSAYLTEKKVHIWYKKNDSNETFTTGSGSTVLKRENLATIHAVQFEKNN